MEWYRERPLPMRQVAQELGVSHLGECSVLKDVERNQIRLTFQLLDGGTGAQIWAESYEEDLSARGIFDIHSDVATQVAQGIGALLTPEEQARIETAPTTSLRAYELYHQGRYLMDRRTAEGFVCPCHGAEYGPLGEVISGPARRPLPWYRVWLERDGRLWVNVGKPLDEAGPTPVLLPQGNRA